ncbi:phosphate ABC transporter permease PstA [Sphaerisporangium sp. B11E5]|uniref:phosphate ABC transporter permease PstA n=1 Tax=Sphaerisporangium sp. B11E5 TaxID=3153563 RepID=UPI00325D67F3
MTAPTVTEPRTVTLTRQKVPWADIVFKLMLRLCLLIAVAFLATLLIYVVYKGWSRLDPRLWDNFPSIRRPERAGARSALYGTLWVISLTAVFCLPVGILAAVYLEEYANPARWYNRMIELNIANLAAIPSIVYGILGLGVIARGFGFGTTILTASITLSLLVLPIVIIASREAIRAVPLSIRQASYGLGATKWQTTWRQILPAAIPGMATGSILALSRAAGEAAPLLLLGGLTYVAFLPDGILSEYTVLPIQIYGWISQSREAFHDLSAAAIVLLLLVIIAMNSIAIYVRNRAQKRW